MSKQFYFKQLSLAYVYCLNVKCPWMFSEPRTLFFYPKIKRGGIPRDVVAHVLEWDIIVNEFELQLRYQVRFQLILLVWFYGIRTIVGYFFAKSIFTHVNRSISNNSV